MVQKIIVYLPTVINYYSIWNMKRFLLLLTMTISVGFCQAAESDINNDAVFLALRDSVHHAFNDGDSARFFPAVKKLEEYVLSKNDLHAYYNQRCNEIVFQMNQMKIFEAYKLARDLSAELREKKLDKEMYMATNMLGHINNYCGNKGEAKDNWRETLQLMEKEGYYSNMPPIIMNMINVATDDNVEETDSLLAKALAIAKKYSPERVFDIESRQTLSYYYRGDYPKFLEGYKAFKVRRMDCHPFTAEVSRSTTSPIRARPTRPSPSLRKNWATRDSTPRYRFTKRQAGGRKPLRP